jgi:hypothetical protein
VWRSAGVPFRAHSQTSNDRQASANQKMKQHTTAIGDCTEIPLSPEAGPCTVNPAGNGMPNVR